MVCQDAFQIYKEKRNNRSANDPDYVAPIADNSADVQPYTIVTRSMTKKIEKNEVLKKVFNKEVDRYPLRSHCNENFQSKRSYYESEESDTDKKPIRIIKQRRHSEGANLQKGDNSNSETSTCVNEHGEPCSICYVKILLNLDESEPVESETKNIAGKIAIKKCYQRRKSEPNVFHAEDRPTYHENLTTQRHIDISQCKHSNGLPASRPESGKNIGTLTKKPCPRRTSESDILHIENKTKSSEGCTLNVNKRFSSKYWEPDVKQMGSKKISQRRQSEGGCKKVESCKEPVAKDLCKNKTENADEKATKRINQRRNSESHILHVSYCPPDTNKAESKKNSQGNKYEGEKVGSSEKSSAKSQNTVEEIKKHYQRRKSDSGMCHIKNLESSSESYKLKTEANKKSQTKQNIPQRSAEKSTKNGESVQVSKKAHKETETLKQKRSSDIIIKSDAKNYLKCENLKPKTTSGSGSSHKIEKAISKNTDTKKSSKNELKNQVDSKESHNEKSSTSRQLKEDLLAGRVEKGHSATNSHNKGHSESDSLHNSEKGVKDSRKRRSKSGSPNGKERDSRNVKTQSNQEHGEKRRKSDEKRRSEGETPRVKEKECLKDTKKSEHKHREPHKEVHKDAVSATEKLHKDSKLTSVVTNLSNRRQSEGEEKDTKKPSEQKRGEPYKKTNKDKATEKLHDSKVTSKNTSEKNSDKKTNSFKSILTSAKKHFDSVERTQKKSLNGKDLLSVKRVSFGNNGENTLSLMCKTITNRRKSDSAALPSISDKLKTHTSEETQKESDDNSLLVSIEKGRLRMFSNESEKDTDLNLDDEVFSKSGTSTDTEGCTNMQPIVSVVRSDHGRCDVDMPISVEDQLKEMFHDTLDSERALEDLVQILSTSRENLDESFKKSLFEAHGTSNQINKVVNCGRHPEKIMKYVPKASGARNIIVRESHKSTGTAQKRMTQKETDSIRATMTKMEHYKKRLLQQHERPSPMVSPAPTTEEEYDSPPQSPTNPSQNNPRERKKEEMIQSKVARKRAVCRSKFRHQNLELFKLGSSIPTSLCKTKEPYNVCTEKNLQMCNQSQNGKKSEENIAKESITESIINTMEGNKRKDILWRSISLNNDKSEKPNKPSNIVETTSKNNSGRHILPAIVPEIPERRKAKTNIRENKTGTTEKGNRMETDLMIRNADPISINKRKTVVKRRKTVIGIESCETEGQNADEESVSDSLDGPNRETDSEPASRRRQSVSTESEVSNNSPINLSLRNKEPSTRVEVAPARVINDPRLYTKPSQYLQHILPNPCNTLTTSSAQNHESTRVGEQSTATTSITYNHEPARTRTTGSDGQFTHSTPQTHEPGRNYVAPNIPPVQSQEPIQNYNTGLAIPSTSSSNHEPSRNYVAEYSTLSALSKRFEPLNNNAAASINTPRLLFQNHEPPRSYFPVPSTTSSASIASYQSSFAGANFPQIQQQMTRLDNATLPVQNWPVNPSVTYNEEVIKTIIQLAKSSMNPNFSIETLLILNKWFIELRSHSTQQAISKRIKTSIMRTLNEIILYVCEKLFGVPCYAQLKSYVEQIIQVVAPRHKDLLTDLLPSFRINYNNEQWMSGIIKLLSLPALPPDPRNQVNTLHNLGHNIVNTHPNAMYNVPVTSHNFPHPPQNLPLVPQNHPPPAQNQPMASQNYPLPPQNYFYQNFLQPSLSYQGYPYQPNSSLQANYLLNTEHQRALMPYQNNGPLEAAAELQRNQQNIQALYQNAIQNFQRPPDNYNPLPVSRPEMFLADNRCVPSEQGLQRLQDQNKRSKSKSKKKDRLDIIPIIPATSAVMAVPNNVNNHSQKVTSDQDRQPTNKISKKPIKTRTPVISRQSSETSTCSSNSTEQRTAPDVEELLQTNFIYNNSRMGNANTDETTSATTKTNLPTSDKSTTNKDVNGKNDENIITVINNSESNNLTDMMQEMMTIDSQDIKSEDAVANTVIVKDKSMEITRGKSNECFSSKELKDEVMDEVSNDVILEKVQNETDDSTASTSVQIDLGMLIKDEVKVELHGLTNKMRQLVGGNNPALKLQIIREVLGDNEDYLQYLLDRRAQRNKLLDPNEVIMIDDDDEDMSIEKVPDMQQATDNDRPPKLIKLVPTKRKDNESDREHQEKKLRTKVPSSKKSNEIIIVDANVEDIQSNSDCNQNYITTITDETKIDELPKEPNEESDSVTPSIRVLSDKTTPSPIKTSTVVTDVIETTNSPIVNPQTPSAAVAETPVIEDISSDEEYTKHFRLHSRYVRKPIENAEDIPDNLEVSQCTLIESTVNSIVKASKNGNFSDKPLVYTRAAMPRNRSEKSSATKTNEQGTIIESRKWSCLSSIIRFEEDSSTTTSFVNVQPAWDVNYVGPQLPERHYPASPPYHIAAESSLTLPQYANDRFRTSPMSSPSRRFSPDFRSPSRSVPTSPVCPSPSTTPSLVMSPSTSATAQTEFNKSRVNWQDWFAEEKSKGFFNFDRSQSVESESASRRRSVDTVGSGGSDYCSKILPEDNYCEIKIDSKTCRIKRTLYNRIPKGKLCYIRENNTFIRYFDDSQMELFIRNLNISEGSSIASDLLKQIKGRVEGVIDVETSLSQYEASGKNEIITLPKAVTFSTADNLSDPVLYVEEVEKVQQYVPRDFYGFYKYVTGYQIVNHHTPISFQTFLTMHNTNGIKGLFKTYVKTMIDGHTIL